MKAVIKKLILTLTDIIVVIIAALWVLWLYIYFVQSLTGAILTEGAANVFERNYLVPAQIFGITAAVTAASIIIYVKLRKKHLIGKGYILLILFNTVFFWYITIQQIKAMIDYRYMIY